MAGPSEYLLHYHREHNHQGKGNVLSFPSAQQAACVINARMIAPMST